MIGYANSVPIIIIHLELYAIDVNAKKIESYLFQNYNNIYF
jgi:hypothetical protein